MIARSGLGDCCFSCAWRRQRFIATVLSLCFVLSMLVLGSSLMVVGSQTLDFLINCVVICSDSVWKELTFLTAMAPLTFVEASEERYIPRPGGWDPVRALVPVSQRISSISSCLSSSRSSVDSMPPWCYCMCSIFVSSPSHPWRLLDALSVMAWAAILSHCA